MHSMPIGEIERDWESDLYREQGENEKDIEENRSKLAGVVTPREEECGRKLLPFQANEVQRTVEDIHKRKRERERELRKTLKLPFVRSEFFVLCIHWKEIFIQESVRY